MDIKVNIDGVLREVCGVTEGTTCEEVIFKLAQVASLPGFYTLVASIREEEVTLSPDERIINFIKELALTTYTIWWYYIIKLAPYFIAIWVQNVYLE
ncbi:unnamed protein product [Trichobilharzia regenti]|nr:unnamed protein product [Trichobilharzia regenti]